MRRVTGLLALVLCAAALTGCAARLAPAPGTVVAPGPGTGAVAREAGIQLSARAHAWRNVPSTLEMIVTPIFVTIENNGTVPLRVRREDFALVAADGARSVARGPYEIEGFASEHAPAGFAYPRASFGIGHGWYRGGRFGLGMPFGGDPFLYDDYYYPMFVNVPLPTGDMIQMALPERVLEPGARAEGFLYFDRVDRKAKRVDFTARLVNATSGDQIGTITIPFVVD
jgi:hypothetical protein